MKLHSRSELLMCAKLFFFFLQTTKRRSGKIKRVNCRLIIGQVKSNALINWLVCRCEFFLRIEQFADSSLSKVTRNVASNSICVSNGRRSETSACFESHSKCTFRSNEEFSEFAINILTCHDLQSNGNIEMSPKRLIFIENNGRFVFAFYASTVILWVPFTCFQLLNVSQNRFCNQHERVAIKDEEDTRNTRTPIAIETEWIQWRRARRRWRDDEKRCNRQKWDALGIKIQNANDYSMQENIPLLSIVRQFCCGFSVSMRIFRHFTIYFSFSHIKWSDTLNARTILSMSYHKSCK